MKKESNVYFKVIYDNVKLSYLTNSKDKIPTLNQSFVVYHFSCPDCSNCYVGKTERTIYERTHEHGRKDKMNAINKHIKCCSGFQHILDLQKLDDSLFDNIPSTTTTMINDQIAYTESGRNNTRLIDKSNNWNTLLIKESLYIKQHKQLVSSRRSENSLKKTFMVVAFGSGLYIGKMETHLESMITSNCKNSNDSNISLRFFILHIIPFLQIIATPPPRRASLGLLNMQ